MILVAYCLSIYQQLLQSTHRSHLDIYNRHGPVSSDRLRECRPETPTVFVHALIVHGQGRYVKGSRLLTTTEHKRMMSPLGPVSVFSFLP